MIIDSLNSIHDQGICLIPVGEKDKAARVKWGAISSPFSMLELTDLMRKYDTNAVAMICGSVSENLFVIDFDVKNKTDLGDGKFLGLFCASFNDLVFQVEQTPSGGYHILYKVVVVPQGIEFSFNKKAASRYSTPEELIANPKDTKKCFIEIKGNGNICQCFPSPGYIWISGKIGNVGWDRHLSVISFLRSFNECIEDVKVVVDIKRNEKNWYIEGKNPFDEFNLNHTGGILQEEGWSVSRDGSRYVTFARPGLKDYYVGASYDKDVRMYNIFTTSGGLDSRSYNPSDLLCLLRYSGDKYELGQWLVSQGYGKLKPSIERSLIKRAAKYGTDVPLNISEEGKGRLEEEKAKVNEKYPNGIFWEINDKDEFSISQKKLDSVIISLGFRNVVGIGLVILDGWKVKIVEEGRIFHTVINYILRVEGFNDVDEIDGILEKIEEEDRINVEKIYNEYSAFIHKYSKVTIEHLKEFGRIQDGKVLVSGKYESFKFYRNCYVSCNKDGIEVLGYDKLGDKLVLESSIIQRDFSEQIELRDSKPYQFFEKAIGIDSTFLTILGYLAHDFIDDSMNAIFVGLGSPGCGKNLFFNLLNHITTVHVIDGGQIEMDKNLLNSFNGERVLVISDVEKNFKYEFFKNFSSGAASLKKLYKDIVILKRSKMPKPCILTNFSYKMVSGLERRIVDIEFRDFFSKIKGGVQTHFKMMFPGYDIENKGSWSEYDWNCFDTICLNAICAFLKVGEIIPRDLTENSWYKRFEVNYSYLLDFFQENFDKWISLGKVKCEDWESEHLNWVAKRRLKGNYKAQSYNVALSEYCEYLGYEFKKDATLRDEHGFNKKFKTFTKKGAVVIKEEIINLPF